MTATERLNNVTEILEKRSSVRDFSTENVSGPMLDSLLRASVRAPTSFGFQAYTMVIVTNSSNLKQLSSITNKGFVCQAGVFVLFCSDLSRLMDIAAEEGVAVDMSNDDLFLSSAIDASLVGMSLTLAAESAGLGTVMVGAVRNRPAEVSDCLGLPEYVVPLFGLCLGWPAQKPDTRLRLRPDIVMHREKYSTAKHPTDQRNTFRFPDRAVSTMDVTHWRREVVRGLRRAIFRGAQTE